MLRAVKRLGARSVHSVSCGNSLVGSAPTMLGVRGGSEDGGEDERPLRWYSCGPTVYDSSHLGHARTYVCTDIIRRILSNYFHIPVHFALGITDVDDKIINRAKESGYSDWKGMKEFAKQFEESFFDDMSALGVERPHAILRVTDHMKEIEEFVETLQDKQYAYEGPDGVWFDVKKIEDTYGALGNIPPVNEEEQEESVESGKGKKFSRDFSLWKAAKAGEPFYDSDSLGAGRPGWHIECSAIVNSYFGSHIDIHSGGVDLKFPHHTNEIAQSEAYLDATGKRAAAGLPWCRTWLHTGHLYIDGLKMSKSLKNFISIREYLEGGYSSHPADDFRLFCLQHKYHSSLHFSKDRIHQAAALREKVRGFLYRCDEAITSRARGGAGSGGSNGDGDGAVAEDVGARALPLTKALLSSQRGISKALADDFDTPTALQHVSALMTEASIYLQHLDRDSSLSTDPLLLAARQVDSFFLTMGLSFSRAASGGEGGEAHAEQASGAGAGPAVMEALVAFRSKVRSQALSGLKKSGTDPKDALTAILKECDRQRDEVVPALGYKLDDKPSGESTFRRA